MPNILKGRRIDWERKDFPYHAGINYETIYDEAHFVLPFSVFGRNPRTLEDYNQTEVLAKLNIDMINNFAQSFTNGYKYRGSNKLNPRITGVDGFSQDRITVIATYVPKRIRSEVEHFMQEELFERENIAAIVFSFLVRDPELRIDQMLDDQLDINAFGLPTYCKRDEYEDDEEEERPAGAELGDIDVDRAEEELFDEFVNPAGVAVEVRPDVPDAPQVQARFNYNPIDARGSRYCFVPKLNSKQPKIPQVERGVPTDFEKIKSVQSYFKIACKVLARVGLEPQQAVVAESKIRISQLPTNHPWHHRNAFSLWAALEKLRDLGAAVEFTDMDEWYDVHSNYFSPPCNDLLGVAVHYPLTKFNATELHHNCLPHCHVWDRSYIRPVNEKRTVPTVMVGNEEIDLELLAEDLGIELQHEKERKLQQKYIFRDPFDFYHSEYAGREAELRKLFTPNTMQRYYNMLHQLRKQGRNYYTSLMETNAPDLPEAYKKLINYANDIGKWEVKVMHIYQAEECGEENVLTWISQWRSNQLMFAETCMRVADTTLLLFPRLIRQANIIYLPETKKEHRQLIGGPGDGKSRTILQLLECRIPDTYKEKSGSSPLAMIGSMQSERMLDIYEELPEVLAPKKDPSGQLLELMETMLLALEGTVIRETTIKNEKTDERIFIRKRGDRTNGTLGARNPGRHTYAPNGTAEAMHNRQIAYDIIPVSMPHRANIAESIFAQIMKNNEGQSEYKWMCHTEQRAVMEYCANMGTYGVPEPDISLFSDLAPIAIGVIATQYPSIMRQLRRLENIKTKVMAEVVANAARVGVMSGVGLAGRSDEPYVFDTDEVLTEMAKYACCDMETLFYVLSESIYDILRGEYNSVAAQILIESANYLPYGYAEEDETADYWPQHIDTSLPALSERQAIGAKNQEDLPAHYSIERFVEVLKRDGKDVLREPRVDHFGSKKGAFTWISRTLRPYKMKHEDYEIFTTLNRANSAEQRPHRLKRERGHTQYKIEEMPDGTTLINYNYVMLEGSFADFASSSHGTIGCYDIDESTMRDILYKLKRQTIVTPYIPCISTGSVLADRPGDMQSLRYSSYALSHPNLYKLPVIIQSTDCFYMLAAFAETNPRVLIQTMLDSMCYHKTREFNCLIGVPMTHDKLLYDKYKARPRVGKKLKLARSSNLSKEKLERLEKQFGVVLSDLEGNTYEKEYKEVDIERERIMAHVRREFPMMEESEIEIYTPKGIRKRMFDPRTGVYSKNGKYHHKLTNELYESSVQAPKAIKRTSQQNQSAKRQQSAVKERFIMAPQTGLRELDWGDFRTSAN